MSPARKWVAMQIESRSPDELKPYPGNPRKIPRAAVNAVAASIERYGFRQPIVVDADGVVIVGHTRLQAAQKLGMESVPVHEADLTPEQARAYRLADNRTNEFAAWDDEALTLELEALVQSMDADLAALPQITAFDTRELDRLLGPPPGQTDPDAVPEPPNGPMTKPGDVWLLDRHRLMCGDCTSAEDVERLLDGSHPNLMVTDPPYGVDYDPGWRNRNLGKQKGRCTDAVPNDDRADWRGAWALFPGQVAYVWHAGAKANVLALGLEECGFQIRSQIIWVKQNFVISRGHYHSQHEPCWYAVRKGGNGRWIGDRKQATVWQVANRAAFGGTEGDASTRHSTQKPVECMERPIRNHEGDVYEPFSGSGTTIIAAERQGRACCAMEIEPRYVDMAVARWEVYTGRKAERI